MKMQRITLVAILVLIGFYTQEVFPQAPAPIYRDPITDGAADPTLIYNPFEQS